MCTSLLYRDASDRPYLGRTLELSVDLPYQVAVLPKGLDLSSTVKGHPSLRWRTRRAVIAITMPAAPPAPGTTPGVGDLKIIEGLNDAGLSFSVQSYSQAAGPQSPVDGSRAVLSAADLGAWVLGQFSTVAAVEAALADMPIRLEPVPILGGLEMPFHYSVHDSQGASLVIEFHKGVRSIYDNPVGVMTNAPQFSWHLTNLDNYTFLDNIDRSRANFGRYEAVQPGAGIAKAGLPGADTSVDRFVRATFYAQFAEKQSDPDKAVQMVAHIMNNFDRPRGITVDPPELGSGHLEVQGHQMDVVPTEFTSWTSISDLTRGLFFVRDSRGMNYIRLDIGTLVADRFKAIPMATLMTSPTDVTSALTTG